MRFFRDEFIQEKSESVAYRRSRFAPAATGRAHKAMPDARQVSRDNVSERLRAIRPRVAVRVGTVRWVKPAAVAAMRNCADLHAAPEGKVCIEHEFGSVLAIPVPNAVPP